MQSSNIFPVPTQAQSSTVNIPYQSGGTFVNNELTHVDTSLSPKFRFYGLFLVLYILQVFNKWTHNDTYPPLQHYTE